MAAARAPVGLVAVVVEAKVQLEQRVEDEQAKCPVRR